MMEQCKEKPSGIFMSVRSVCSMIFIKKFKNTTD